MKQILDLPPCPELELAPYEDGARARAFTTLSGLHVAGRVVLYRNEEGEGDDTLVEVRKPALAVVRLMYDPFTFPRVTLPPDLSDNGEVERVIHSGLTHLPNYARLAYRLLEPVPGANSPPNVHRFAMSCCL